MLKVTLPGTGGTVPMKNRWLSSCLLSSNGHSVLIDCGEGTQIALKCAEQKVKPIDTICITHFHADHISGLPGLLLTMSNEGRTEPITIAGPVGVGNVVRSLCVIAPQLPYRVDFIEYEKGLCFKSADIIIKAFPLRHSIPCIGYSFELKRSGKFDTEKAKLNNVPLPAWSRLQKMEEVEYNGRVYTPDMVLGAERKGIKVTYATDTRPTSAIYENALDSDLFICEGMFGDNDLLSHAKEKRHMLFSEAASLAVSAKAKKLWLTHYSPSLKEPEEYIQNALDIFPFTECGFDGKTIDLQFPEV